MSMREPCVHDMANNNPTMTTAARRKPVQRLFTRLAGSPLSVTQEPTPTKSAAALRGERFRQRQKANQEYAKKQAARMKKKRAVDKIVAENPDGPLLTMTDAPEDKKVLITGGYGSQKVDTVEALNREKGSGRKVQPAGFGASSFEKNDGVEEDTIYIEPPRSSSYASRGGKKLKDFVFGHLRKNDAGEYVCVGCGVVLGIVGALQVETEKATALHYEEKHPKAWKMFQDGLKPKKRKCQEDHAGMAERKGRGSESIHCGRCKVIIWRPPAASPERSHAETDSNLAA